MVFPNINYVTYEGLKNLSNYKYHGVDKSLVAKYIGQPFWTTAVNLLPLWMAPNLVTLIGFFFIIIAYGTTAYYLPLINGTAPSWVYLMNAVFVWIYQTMDALDGKQARRTGTSSPLGELFDHGCDAVTTSMICLISCCAIQLGANWLLFSIILSSLVVFFFAQWEEYYTGTMELGYINVTEAQISIMLLNLVSFWFGADFWLNEVTVFGYSIPYQYFMLIGTLGTTYYTIFNNIKNVASNVKSNQRKEALNCLIPIFGVILTSIYWAYFSQTNILQNMPHYFGLTLGFLNAGLVGRIVVARVCQEKFNPFQPILLGLVIACINCFFNGALFDEILFLKIYTVVSTLFYLHFAISIIEIMCAHLKIKCLQIPYKKKDEKKIK